MSAKKYKIVYIGAGSFRFTIPCGVNILDFAKTFHPVDLWFVDIDPVSLRLMGSAMRQMIYMHGLDIKLHLTTDRRLALKDADYVLISISVGIQRSEWFDIHIPLKFGIPQNTGDTVGPGGIFRAIRTIPVFLEIFKDIEELCPEATILNYTNPQGTLMLSVFQDFPKLQAIGLCHEIFYVKTKKFGRFLKLCGADKGDKNDVNFIYGGLNHFSWIKELTYNGKDLYPKMRENAKYAYESEKFGRPYNYYMLDKIGYFCYVEDRHVVEFIPKYYNYFNYKEQPFGIKLRNVRMLHVGREMVYSIVRWAQKNRNRWFIKLFVRPMEGGEKALLMAKDKERNLPKHHVCNVLNKGAIPSLPDNCVVEMPCYFKDGKLRQTKVGSMPKVINDLILPYAKNQQLIVNAAKSGNTDDLLKALVSDPMCQFIEDDDKVEAMMYNMLYYERKWLPHYSESILTYSELKKLKYHINKEELSSFTEARKEKYAPAPELKSKAWPYVD
ncbi:MAG: family 4 glycosyl hydrolase [Promethearchaeota archaeon]